MNQKEIAEIRRRLRPDKNNISQIRGCYVNDKHEIVSSFQQSLHLMSEEETESILAVFKRTLSGTLGKNLHDLTFDTAQVADSDEHRLLTTLRNSALQDEAAAQTLFERVISTLHWEGSYLILLTHDTYDVPYRSQDGQRQDDASSAVYSYLLCSICPLKPSKPALSYYMVPNEFHHSKSDSLVGAPELGFLFPAYHDGGADLYGSLYYSRDIAENHKEFVETVFRRELPMPAAAQKETFETLLTDTLDEDCSYEVVQAVHEQLCELILEHKVNHEAEPLAISKGTVKQVLQNCGVSETHVSAFDEKYDAEFGTGAELCPQNIVDAKQFEVCTPDVTIRVNPERSSLLETRVIDGTKYILVRADENIEVNGVSIHV